MYIQLIHSCLMLLTGNFIILIILHNDWHIWTSEGKACYLVNIESVTGGLIYFHWNKSMLCGKVYWIMSYCLKNFIIPTVGWTSQLSRSQSMSLFLLMKNQQTSRSLEAHPSLWRTTHMNFLMKLLLTLPLLQIERWEIVKKAFTTKNLHFLGKW